MCDSHTHPMCLLLRPDRENLETTCLLVDVIVPALPPLTNFEYEGGGVEINMEDDEVPNPLLSPCVRTLESPTGSNQVLQLRSCHGKPVGRSGCLYR